MGCWMCIGRGNSSRGVARWRMGRRCSYDKPQIPNFRHGTTTTLFCHFRIVVKYGYAAVGAGDGTGCCFGRAFAGSVGAARRAFAESGAAAAESIHRAAVGGHRAAGMAAGDVGAAGGGCDGKTGSAVSGGDGAAKWMAGR